MSIEAPPAPAPRTNPLQRLGGVIAAPDRTLREIAVRPDWIVPLLLILIISIVSAIFVTPRVDWESTVREQMEDDGRSPEEIEQAIEIVGKFQKFTLPLTAAFVPIFLIIIAACFLLGFKVMGGEGGFKQSWAVTLYSWIPQLIKGIIASVLIIRAGTVTAEEAGTLLKSNLGFLADMSDAPALFTLLSSIDVFNIWTVILLVIGLAYAHRVSRAKSAAIVVTLWVVSILVRVGLAALQGVGGPG